MAKVAILTQPLGGNYGGILQAFALQQVLCELGHEPLTIDRVHSGGGFVLRWAKQIAKYLLGHTSKLRYYPTHKELALIQQHTLRFVREQIKVSPRIHSTTALRRYAKACHFDAYIVGSDQVWRKDYAPCLSEYFLGFLPQKSRAKRLAYAASFGEDVWRLNARETNFYSSLLKQFDWVSVREDSAVELCREHLGVEATHVLDPTLLLHSSVYEQLALSANTHPAEGNLFCYILDRTPSKMEVAANIAKEKGLNPFELMPEMEFAQVNSKQDLNRCILPPVEQWLRSFVDAEAVVTDSYHGMLFSILFDKPFVVLPNVARGASRFTSLFKQLGLELPSTPRLVSLTPAQQARLEELRTHHRSLLNNALR